MRANLFRLWPVIALIAAFATTGICLVIDDAGQVRVFVPKPTPIPEGVSMDANNEMSIAEREESAARPFSVAPEAPPLSNAGPDIHEDTRDETPPGITREEADEALLTPPGVGPGSPPAGAQLYRCEQNFVRNYSPRAAGARVSMMVLHFTVSRPGSLRAIWNLFNTPSFGASSTFLMELDNECEQIVPLDKKSWTQGAFNSVSESWEIVTNDLSRSQWLTSPILARGVLANHVADRLRARGLPARLVDPVGCTPKAGVTDHNRLECGNSHWDVGKNFPWDVFMAQVRRYYSGASRILGTARQRAACRKLNWWRRTREPGQARLNAVARKKVLRKRGFNCTREGLTLA